MANQLRFISKVVYRLKRRYGQTVDVVRVNSSVANFQTGLKAIQKDSIRVNRAIILPSQVKREFAYDLAFIATNKNFTYGGHYDTTMRRMIFDVKDLPDFPLEVGMYVLFEGVRYDMKQVERFEDNRSYFVTVKQLIESPAETIHYVNAGSELILESGANTDD